MTDTIQTVIDAIAKIAIQTEGLAQEEISASTQITGSGSRFDSFSILLLSVELEQSLPADALAGRSIFEWFTALPYSDGDTIDVARFAKFLEEFLR